MQLAHLRLGLATGVLSELSVDDWEEGAAAGEAVAGCDVISILLTLQWLAIVGGVVYKDGLSTLLSALLVAIMGSDRLPGFATEPKHYRLVISLYDRV